MVPLIISIILIILFGLVLILNKTFDRSRKQILLSSKDLSGVDYRFFKQETDWLKNLDKTERIIESVDGLGLRASFITSQKTSKLCIVLCHGYSSNRTSMAVYARYYYEHYNAHLCLIDARAHGLSEGNTIGFGYHDRNDLHQWINELKNTYGSDLTFILHGVSMGASTLLYAAIDGFDQAIKGIVVDSAFIDLRPIFIRQMRQIYHLPKYPFILFVDFAMKYLYKIPFSQTNIIKQKDKLLTPCLIIHGTVDRFVPFEMAETLNRIYPAYHRFLPIVDANHALGFAIDPTHYKIELESFITYCLNQ